MSDLAETAEDLVTYLEFNLQGALDATEPDAIAGPADAACTYFQGVGICELLLDAEVEAFFQCMVRSARMRRWLLRLAQQPVTAGVGYPARVTRATNTRGLFAAVLAGDWALSAEIAALSAKQWNDRVEYEDDFYYAHFVHRHLAGDIGVLGHVLTEYRRALDGDEASPRFRLCASLLAPNTEGQALARTAFVHLIDARREEMRRIRDKSILGTDELFVPFSSIYVEGLAWLRLLERAGIAMEREYPFCPSLARSGTYAPLPSDSFPP